MIEQRTPEKSAAFHGRTNMSGKKCFADLKISVRVYFEDDGETDLKTQAVEAWDKRLMTDYEDDGIEVIGVPQEHV